MRERTLGTVEKKVLGALLILSDHHNVVNSNTSQIAKTMGYKRSGGAISFALKSLEHNNHITYLSDSEIKVLL